MNQLQFDSHKNFFLHADSWGEAQLFDIAKLFDSIITDFYNILNKGMIIVKPDLTIVTTNN